MSRKRARIALVCDECGSRNYWTTKASGAHGEAGPRRERLSLKKFCPKCNRHTTHRESK